MNATERQAKIDAQVTSVLTGNKLAHLASEQQRVRDFVTKHVDRQINIVEPINAQLRPQKATRGRDWIMTTNAPASVNALHGTEKLAVANIRAQPLLFVEKLKQVHAAGKNAEVGTREHDNLRAMLANATAAGFSVAGIVGEPVVAPE